MSWWIRKGWKTLIIVMHSLRWPKRVSNFSVNAFTFPNCNCQCLCKFFINLNFSSEYFPHLVFALSFIYFYLTKLNLSTDNILPQNCNTEGDWLSLHKYYLQIKCFWLPTHGRHWTRPWNKCYCITFTSVHKICNEQEGSNYLISCFL